MAGNTINIRNNFPAVAAALDRVAVNVGNRAMVRAMNTTIEQGKTQMARQITKEFRLSLPMVKERLTLHRASSKSGGLGFEAKLEASRRGKGRSMNLIHFIEKSVTMAESRRRAKAGEGGVHTLRNGGRVGLAHQLRFQILRSGGKKMIKGIFIGNRGRTVFMRTGKGRLPIKAVGTIDIPQMFNTRRINKVVVDVIRQRFEANFKRELRSLLQGYAK